MNIADYGAKRTKQVDALLSDPAWVAACTKAGATPSRRQARKYLNGRGKTYRWAQHR